MEARTRAPASRLTPFAFPAGDRRSVGRLVYEARVLLPRDELHRTVARVVRAIPRGKVLSYSRVAVLAGLPGRARLIGKVMGRIGSRLPWWRVLRADRTMAEEVRSKQARRLCAEGVKISASGRVPRSAFLPIGDETLHRRIRQGGR